MLELTEELWMEVFCYVITPTDSMIQICYRNYTPLQLFCMWKRDSALCHTLSGSCLTAHLNTWFENAQRSGHFGLRNVGFPNICNPPLCLLGANDDEEMSNATKMFVRHLLSYV